MHSLKVKVVLIAGGIAVFMLYHPIQKHAINNYKRITVSSLRYEKTKISNRR